MIYEIIAIINTMVVIFVIQSIINSIWRKKLGKFGVGALIHWFDIVDYGIVTYLTCTDKYWSNFSDQLIPSS